MDKLQQNWEERVGVHMSGDYPCICIEDGEELGVSAS